jgi:hypothetical protein
MNEEASSMILPALVAGLLLIYVGFKVQRKRESLRRIFGVMDEPGHQLVALLEGMVQAGELRPVGQPA